MMRQLGIDHDAFSFKFQGFDAKLTGVEGAKVIDGRSLPLVLFAPVQGLERKNQAYFFLDKPLNRKPLNVSPLNARYSRCNFAARRTAARGAAPANMMPTIDGTKFVVVRSKKRAR